MLIISLLLVLASIFGIVPRRRRRGKRGPKRSNVNFSMSNPIVMYARSLVDPFNNSGCIPDGSTGKGCFSMKIEQGLATGTGTCNTFAWCPHDITNFYLDTTSTAATPVVTGNWTRATAYTTISALYSTQRPISAGIRGKYIGNTQTDGGVVLVGMVSSQTALNVFNGASITGAASAMMDYRTYALREGFEIHWTPQSQEDTESWVIANGAATAVSALAPADYLLVIVYGANSSQSTLQLEVIANMEGQFAQQSFNAGGIRNEEPAVVGWYEKAKNLTLTVPKTVSLQGRDANSFSWTKLALGGVYEVAKDYVMGNGMRYAKETSRSFSPSQLRLDLVD
jgi:hypothetical protein